MIPRNEPSHHLAVSNDNHLLAGSSLLKQKRSSGPRAVGKPSKANSDSYGIMVSPAPASQCDENPWFNVQNDQKASLPQDILAQFPTRSPQPADSAAPDVISLALPKTEELPASIQAKDSFFIADENAEAAEMTPEVAEMVEIEAAGAIREIEVEDEIDVFDDTDDEEDDDFKGENANSGAK